MMRSTENLASILFRFHFWKIKSRNLTKWILTGFILVLTNGKIILFDRAQFKNIKSCHFQELKLNHSKVIGIEPLGDLSLDCFEFKFLCFKEEPEVNVISDEEYMEHISKGL